MSKQVIRLLIIFFLYLAVQILFARNLILFNKAFCFIYVVIILLMPLEMNRLYLLLIAFLTGLAVDAFYNSGAIHAASLLLVAFLRPLWVNLITPKGGYELGTIPNLRTMGFSWFLTYSLPLVFIHHIGLFFLEAATIDMFWYTFSKVILSTVFSFTVIVILQYLFHRKSRAL